MWVVFLMNELMNEPSQLNRNDIINYRKTNKKIIYFIYITAYMA